MGTAAYPPLMNLILLHPDEVDARGQAMLRDDRARHIREVLRADEGNDLTVGVLNGPTGRATVTAIDGDEVALACVLDQPAPPPPRIDLLLAMPRPKVMKRLWAQLAALGAGRIRVTTAWKVERCYFDTHVLDPDFYTPLLVEGLQQARDTRLPEVSIHRRFKVLVEDELGPPDGKTARLVLDPGASTPLADVDPGDADRLLLAVGSEGGWTEYELDLLHAHGFASVALGGRTLRSDTACIAAMAVAARLTRTDRTDRSS